MPIYEYICQDCHSTFDQTLTLAEHDQAEHDRQSVACPKCGGKNVTQGFSSFYPVTSKKSA